MKLLALNGMKLVGYARKSPIGNDPENTTRLMQAMVRNLKERSFASRIYVPSSWASTRLIQRDLKPDNSIMEKLEVVNGNTQDFLEYVKASNYSICLISIDFYGITTIRSDLVQLIENTPAIKKIAIDNEVYIFDAETLKNDQKMLEKFDNRSQFYNRSK